MTQNQDLFPFFPLNMSTIFSLKEKIKPLKMGYFHCNKDLIHWSFLSTTKKKKPIQSFKTTNLKWLWIKLSTMAAKRYWHTLWFSSLPSNGFFYHRQLLVDFSPYVIYSTIWRNWSNTTQMAIVVLKNRLNPSHILPKSVPLLFWYGSKVLCKPVWFQCITNSHKNREFWVIHHAFKWKLDVVTHNHRYTETLDGVEKTAGCWGIPSWVQAEFWWSHPSDRLLLTCSIREPFFHYNIRLINQQVPEFLPDQSSLLHANK